MGLDASFPAVRISDPKASVPVWNESHSIVGRLGPNDNYHSSAVNVSCLIDRPNGRWYQVLNAAAWPPAQRAYVSAAQTFLLPGSPYAPTPCRDNNDQPGRAPFLTQPAVINIAALLASASVAAVLARRLIVQFRHRPVPPGPVEGQVGTE